MIRTIRAILIVAALLAIAVGVQAKQRSVLAGNGYTCTDTTIGLPDFGFLGGFDVLPNGNFVINDGYSLREVAPNGRDIQNLFIFPEYVMASFVRCDHNTLYFGESTTGSSKIYSMSLKRGARAVCLTSLPNNFDMDFCKNKPYIVAGSGIYLLNNNGTTIPVASAPGYSGPLAFDKCGDLFYVPSQFPASTSILRWDNRDVDRAARFGALTTDDAFTVAPIGGAYGLTFDGRNRMLFTDNSGASPLLVRFDGRTMTTLATFSEHGTNFPAITFVRTDDRTGNIYVGVTYYNADFSASYACITTLRENRLLGRSAKR